MALFSAIVVAVKLFGIESVIREILTRLSARRRLSAWNFGASGKSYTVVSMHASDQYSTDAPGKRVQIQQSRSHHH